jgi:hypothetical protein
VYGGVERLPIRLISAFGLANRNGIKCSDRIASIGSTEPRRSPSALLSTLSNQSLACCFSITVQLRFLFKAMLRAHTVK